MQNKDTLHLPLNAMLSSDWDISMACSGCSDGYKPQLLAQQLLTIVVAPLIATVASPNRSLVFDFNAFSFW
ncbi:hypothetical protein P8452_25160 [Trifolium repens]|nr:hypothetical protein P8452_25160 [Trifolium repens]